MKRSSFKPKPCKECGSLWHSKGSHKPKNRMRTESKKTTTKRLETREAWFEANPPDAQGHWHCYISKHPLCPRILDRQTINLEHNLSKARRPDLKYDITNIFPACSYDNKAKGSMSAEEYIDA